MLPPDFSRIFSNGPNLHGMPDDHGARPSANNGANPQYQPRPSRAHAAFERIAQGGINRTMNFLAGQLGQGPTRFADAIERELGLTGQAGHVPHGADHTAHDEGGRFTRPAQQHSMGADFSHIFENMMGGLTERLGAFLNDRPAQITQGLEQFKEQLKHQKHHGGERPPTPTGVSRDMANLIRTLDPDDDQFDQTVLEIAQGYISQDQRAREMANQAIGTAPRPRPGHHRHDGHEGDQVLPDNLPGTDPQGNDVNHDNPLDDLYDDASSTHTRPSGYHPPQVRDAADEQGPRPPFPSGRSNFRE